MGEAAHDTVAVESRGEPRQQPTLAGAQPLSGQDELSERDRRILEFERTWWRHGGAKESAISEIFQMNATRYYQILNVLIDSPAALAAEPMLVKRLRRMRDTRQRERAARRLSDVMA